MRIERLPTDDSERLISEVAKAAVSRTPLYIRGGNSKAFLGRAVEGAVIDTRMHSGIVNYDPTELVITARAGTPLRDLNAAFEAAGQMLPCEPPDFNGHATIGGVVAAGLAGPRRPWSGSVRDFVLGCRVITGHAKHLRFGGEVMKNVAGYDVSRFFAGSYGSLGLLTEVSLKVLPKPRAAASIVLDMEATDALRELSAWRRAALPVSAACHISGRLHVRFEGGVGSVEAALERVRLMGCASSMMDEPLMATSPATFWEDLRDHRLAFFAMPLPLWRLSLPNATPLMPLPGEVLLDWGGAQRWLKSDAPADIVHRIAQTAGGHATPFGTGSFGSIGDKVNNDNVHDNDRAPYAALPAALMQLHLRLKRQLDPFGVFNPGRLYAAL